MIQISRTGIRNLASNDTVYARGLNTIRKTVLSVRHIQ